eukprot:501261_1
MQTCHGGIVEYEPGWVGIPSAYDPIAWTWEREYVVENSTNITYANYIPPQNIDANIVNIDPCDEGIIQMVTDGCELARNSHIDCCNQIGGTYCDELQSDCEYDVCVMAEGQSALINDLIEEMFIIPVVETCNDCVGCFDLINIIEAPQVPTWNPTLSPTSTPVIPREYIYIEQKLTWWEADQFCINAFNTSLATIEYNHDFTNVIKSIKGRDIVSNLWIGMNDMNKTNQWVWTDNNNNNNVPYIDLYDMHWAVGQPDIGID